LQQEPKLFDISIKENIALGYEGAATDEQIQAAAKKANAHDFIMSFPDGYDTSVGSLGDKLSGTQSTYFFCFFLTDGFQVDNGRESALRDH
jgi:ABC-type multidrug transport system fused ATPase/permease subunit